MTDISKFLISKQKQVLTHLKEVSAERCLISAIFGEDEKDSFLTVIIDIDEKKQTITIDCGPKEYLNQKLLSTTVIKCTTLCGGIEVLFEGLNVKKSGKSGQLAFIISLPDSLYWIQRRDFYRVRSPLSKNSYCTIFFENAVTETSSMKFKLFGLSVNGISLLNDSGDLSKLFTISREFTNCELVLDGEEALAISFSIRHITAVNQKTPGKLERIGCLFTRLSPRAESNILRNMHAIESEIKQKTI